MRRSSRIMKSKSQCECTKKPKISPQESETKKRLQAIAIIIENIIYYDGDIEYSAASNYLNVVKSTKDKLSKNSELISFCDLLVNQLNKIIEIINISTKVETNMKKSGKKETNHGNEVNSSQETYCAALENCDNDPADTNELGSDIHQTKNNEISKKNIDLEDVIPYTIVRQTRKIVEKPIDLSSHKPRKSSSDDVLIKNDQPIDYSSKLNTNNHGKTKNTNTKISKSITAPSNKRNNQNKPEINSCPVLPNLPKPNKIINESYSEQDIFRKPLSYKPKSQRRRKSVLQKSERIEISNETLRTCIDKTQINKLLQMNPPNRSNRNRNPIKKAKTVYNIIKKPEQQQFTIHFNTTPEVTPEKILDTEETYNSEDCFDDIFTENQATDTDENLSVLDLKYKQLNIEENSENTAIIPEIVESADWIIESPIVETQLQPINEASSNEEDLQNKIHEIKSQENFKYNENESVVTNIRNYRKTFVRKILQLRDVMQGTPIKQKNRQNNNSLFKSTNKDGSSDAIVNSQYVCPPSPKNERYKAVEMFVNRENESDEDFNIRLKEMSRELSRISIHELLQKMENYNRL